MDTAWIECGFFVAGQRVNVSVRRLSAEERQRVAAEIANELGSPIKCQLNGGLQPASLV